jgi:hypothetical protein
MTTQTEALKLALEALEPLIVERTCEAMDAGEKAIAAIKEALAQPEQSTTCVEPVAWVPYLSDRADGVKGHYAIARWNPRGYREVWNLRRHEWGAYSDDVLSLEEADTLLRLITIPTRKVTSPQPPQRKPLTDEQIGKCIDEVNATSQYGHHHFGWHLQLARAIEAAHGIKE